MKEIKVFACEFCNTEYKEKREAIECEQHHKKIKSVTACDYSSKDLGENGYPESILVEFDNGAGIRFKRF